MCSRRQGGATACGWRPNPCGRRAQPGCSNRLATGSCPPATSHRRLSFAEVRIAAPDLGSDTFHLLVVDARPEGSFTPILREKEVLRLGDKVGAERRLSEPVMDLAVETVTRFRARAESCGVEELVACATSAIREADNGGELIDRIYVETGVRVRVITGREEARLVFEAVRASVRIDPAPALCLDLGGGSLEVMVGDRSGMSWSSSLKLGAARLALQLVRDDPPSS